ncbi:MAG: DUF885 domain-containing protein, partial [Lewinella sp.]|nr:DUF885 domain-containing protein [Lewinella sp.]
MYRLFLWLALATGLTAATAQPATDDAFLQLRQAYTDAYADLQVPGLQLSYEAYLNNLPPLAVLREQAQFFTQLQQQLGAIPATDLSDSLQLDYFILAHELILHRERLALEIPWAEAGHTPTSEGIFHQPDGRNWYRYLVRRWTGTTFTPEQLFTFGETEVRKINAEIDGIRQQLGMDSSQFARHRQDPSLFTTDAEVLEARFRAQQAVVLEKLGNYFPPLAGPPARIVRGTDSGLAQTPGFYRPDPGTFFYNLFDRPYKWREVDWLFMHEATPGHHYQYSYAARLDLPAFRRLSFQPGYGEGWGAYVEYLGEEIGLYATPYDWLGKWEWDLVRSVRVPLDVGINYFGWTDDEALAYWREHVSGQDEIAMREINRMRRWPAQVHTYKVGSSLFLERLEAARQQPGFDPVAFHRELLDTGPIPCEWFRVDQLSPRERDALLLIRQHIAQFSRDLVARDFEAVTQAYTPDGILLPGKGDILQGETAIRD